MKLQIKFTQNGEEKPVPHLKLHFLFLVLSITMLAVLILCSFSGVLAQPPIPTSNLVHSIGDADAPIQLEM